MVLLRHIIANAVLLIVSTIASPCEPIPPLWVPFGPCHLPGVSSWGTQVAVGNASQQICITPSTVTNSTLLMAMSVCNDAQLAAENMTHEQCASRRGGFLNLGTLPTASDAEQTTLQYLNPGWNKIQGNDAFDSAVTTVLYMHGGMDNGVTMLDIVVTDGQNHTTSQLALGCQSVFLDTLVNTKQIERRSFGINAGSTSITHPRSGSLVFGGYDSASINGAFIEYPMTYPIILNDRVCPLQVTIRQLSLRQPDLPDDILFGEEWPLQACIEPYDNLFRLPDTLVNKNLVPTMERILDSQLVSSPPDPDIWINEPGLLFGFNDSSSFNGSLVFTLDQNFTVEIPSHEIVRPLRGLAPNGSNVINDQFTELQVYPVEPLDAAVLGKIFLSQVYLHVDYDRQVFELANINTDNESILPVTDVTNKGSKCPTGSKGINGATIAIAIAVNVVLLVLLVAIGWVVFSRRRGRRRAIQSTTQQDVESEKVPKVVSIEHLSPITSQISTEGTAASSMPQVQPGVSNLRGIPLPEVSIHQRLDHLHQLGPREQSSAEMQGTSVNQGDILGELPSPASDRAAVVGGGKMTEPRERNQSFASELSTETR